MLTVHVGVLSLCEGIVRFGLFVVVHSKVPGNITYTQWESLVENAGIDPATSRMLSERSTI